MLKTFIISRKNLEFQKNKKRMASSSSGMVRNQIQVSIEIKITPKKFILQGGHTKS